MGHPRLSPFGQHLNVAERVLKFQRLSWCGLEGLTTVLVKFGGKKSDAGIPAGGAQLSFRSNLRKGRGFAGVGTAPRAPQPWGENWSWGACLPSPPRVLTAGSVHHNGLVEFLSWACPEFLFLLKYELALSSLPLPPPTTTNT